MCMMEKVAVYVCACMCMHVCDGEASSEPCQLYGRRSGTCREKTPCAAQLYNTYTYTKGASGIAQPLASFDVNIYVCICVYSLNPKQAARLLSCRHDPPLCACSRSPHIYVHIGYCTSYRYAALLSLSACATPSVMLYAPTASLMIG